MEKLHHVKERYTITRIFFAADDNEKQISADYEAEEDEEYAQDESDEEESDPDATEKGNFLTSTLSQPEERVEKTVYSSDRAKAENRRQ